LPHPPGDLARVEAELATLVPFVKKILENQEAMQQKIDLQGRILSRLAELFLKDSTPPEHMASTDLLCSLLTAVEGFNLSEE
jgi:hypothetical protein